MGLGFTFFTNSKDRTDEIAKLRALAESNEYSVLESSVDSKYRYLCVSFCPAGELLLLFKEGTITCACQTNVAGPGFHVQAIEFLEQFASDCGLTFMLNDETEYYVKRDFDVLKKDHFYPWFSKVVEIVAQRMKTEDDTNWTVCWPLGTYFPESVPGKIVTPLGRFSPESILHWIQTQGIESFADEFFIWNTKEKDARFYRNSALFLMWSDCYFKPDSRSKADETINDRIITLLEKSAALDPTLPFPKREYLDLCALSGRDGINVDLLADYAFHDTIGYRKGIVRHQLGNLSLPLHGCFLDEEYTWEGCLFDRAFFDFEEENWHSLRITAFENPQEEADFSPKLLEEAVGEPIHWNADGVKTRAVFQGKKTESGPADEVKSEEGNTSADQEKSYYSVIAQSISSKQTSYMSFSFLKETEKEWAFSILENLKQDHSDDSDE